MPLFQTVLSTLSIPLHKIFPLRVVVTFSYTLLEGKKRKYSSLVVLKNYPETTYVHFLLWVRSDNIFEHISSRSAFTDQVLGR